MKNMRIGQRLGIGFAVVLGLSIIITAIGFWKVNTVAQATRTMMEVPFAKERIISDWYRYVFAGIRRTTAIVKSSDPSLGAFFAEDAATTVKNSQDLKKRIDEMVSSTEERELLERLSGWSKLYLSTRADITKAKEAGNQEEANKILEQGYLPAAKEYESIVRQLLDLQRKDLDRKVAEVNALEASSQRQLILLALLSLALGVVCAWRLTVGITRPLRTAVAAANRVAEGDLTAEIPPATKDEIGDLLQAMKAMNGNLQKIVGQVRVGTDTIATASTQIASGNQDLSSRTEHQASALQETASSMEELTTTVKQNADNARQANQLAMTATETAAKGGNVVGQVVATMDSINSSSKKVVDIISVIDGIAFQTNILALNAAVEAARAGEQGRGFAVVASEVRALAQRSASAAKEIKSLIDDSVSQVDTGSVLVAQAGETMVEIVDSIKRVADIMGEISAATQEQTTGIEQVNLAIAQMDEATQQNAALVEEAAAAAASMQGQAKELAQAVSLFKLDGIASNTIYHRAEPRLSIPKVQVKQAKVVKAKRLAAPTPAAPKRLPGMQPVSGDDWEEF